MTNGEKIEEMTGRKPCIDAFGSPYMVFSKEWWNSEYEEKPKQGEWIDERNDGGCCTAICSNCKTLEVTGRFCRTCGSDNTQSFLKSFKI